MAIDPKLLVIKPVDELTEVTGLQDGDLLFYDGSGNLKRISIETFNKSPKPLKPTDITPTVAGLYMPTEIGTYANAGGLIAEDGFDTLFYFDGINWTKRALPYPKASNNLPQFANLNFPVTNTATEKVQCVYNNLIVQLKNGKTATIANVPTGKDDDEYWICLGFDPVGFWYKRNIIKGGSFETQMTNFFDIDVYPYFLGHVGNVIAISFDCIAESSTDLLVYPYKNRGISIKDSHTFAVTPTWNRYSYLTEIKNFGLSNVGTTMGSIRFSNNSIFFKIKNVKIEFGLEATPF